MGNCCGSKAAAALRLEAEPQTSELMLIQLGEKPLEDLLAKPKPKYELLGRALDGVVRVQNRLATALSEKRVLGCILSVLLLFIIAFSSATSPPLPSARTKEGKKPDSKVVFFDSEDLPDVIPRPPASYPENIKGVFWMDQWGYYGHSDLSSGFEDGVMSFGDTQFHTLNVSTREIFVSTSGPSWTWLNNAAAYGQYDGIARYGSYFFQWNEDYTRARIWPSKHHNGRNNFGLGGGFDNLMLYFVQFWMTRQTPPKDACPPAADATKEERSACAPWRRDSCLLWCFGSLIGINKQQTYYVFRVVNEKGHKVDPYFTELQNLAYTRVAPDAQAAFVHNITLDDLGHQENSMFHGVYTEPSGR
mmetsp:Transcript_119760/g.310570  ORF Transcript_119760/g.310570 Transcript_119760/m.310570 type:complete len:361 (+) Transcript_119760:88-1170(+)